MSMQMSMGRRESRKERSGGLSPKSGTLHRSPWRTAGATSPRASSFVLTLCVQLLLLCWCVPLSSALFRFGVRRSRMSPLSRVRPPPSPSLSLPPSLPCPCSFCPCVCVCVSRGLVTVVAAGHCGRRTRGQRCAEMRCAALCTRPGHRPAHRRCRRRGRRDTHATRTRPRATRALRTAAAGSPRGGGVALSLSAPAHASPPPPASLSLCRVVPRPSSVIRPEIASSSCAVVGVG